MLTFQNPSFEATVSKEWLFTNGIGGYASSTIIGANTRRYHGLLVASLNPPTQRQVLVSKIEESISIQRNTNIEFSTNQYPGVIHPQGYQYLTSFERLPLPKMTFQIGDQQVAKTVFMVQDSNTTIVEYENIGQGTYQLNLLPFFVNRDYHSLFFENRAYDYYYEQEHNVLKIHSHYGSMPLYVKYYKGTFQENRAWFKKFQYEKEAYRGLEKEEDAYALGSIQTVLEPGEKTYLVFTLEKEMLDNNPKRLKEEAIKQVEALSPQTANTFFNDLAIAAHQVIVKRASTDSYTILAGYHWFTDWGRDTMIAMRGLCIATGKKEVSESILTTFFNYLSKGMLPNRFPDNEGDEVEYNTVDATLWLFVALYEYYQKFQDKTFIEPYFEQLTEIMEWHLKGTRYNIHLTSNGFLFAGEEGVQLTWMDAKVHDFVVTPRRGCPVEIQSLWYNALKTYQFFASLLKIKPTTPILKTTQQVSKKLKKNFANYFYNEQGYLNDVIVPGKMVDDDLRPNQIYAVSLPFSMLTKAQEKSIVTTIQTHLFTPYGLRTLNKEHADFKPIYAGNQWQRDTAYHQGTVWPFLLGDYYMAYLKVHNHSNKAKAEVKEAILVLQNHFYKEACIHGISEIFDGLSSQKGKGTIQQAWSISGLLKVMIDGNLL